MAVVWIPPPIRSLTGGAETVRVQGKTLRQVINGLEDLHPGIKLRLLEGEQVQPALSVVIDGLAVQMGLLEPVGEDSEVHFIPAISGG